MEDLISQLPEPILHHILSLIPVQYAARTSVLSKRWNFIWNTLPFLDFGLPFFFHYRTREDNIQKVVNEIILSRCQRRMENLQKLYLRIPHDNECLLQNSFDVTKLDSLIGLVTESGIRELGLFNHNYFSGEDLLDFPTSILSARSMNTLRLTRFNLMSLSSLSVKFSYLQELRLSCVQLSDAAMEKLIVGCPLLENLYLWRVKGLKNLCLNRSNKLKLVKLYGADKFEMLKIEIENAPDLNFLSVEISSLSKLHVQTFAFMRNVTLFGPFVTEELLHQLSSTIFGIFSLEYLSIGGSRALERIKISIGTIKELKLEKLDKLVDVEINAPLLQRFTYKVGERLPTFCFNVSDKMEVCLDFCHYGHFGSKWSSPFQLIEFLEYFNSFTSIKLSGNFNFSNIIIPKEKRGGLPSPLCGTRNLVLDLWFTKKPLEFVEYMLCLTPRVNRLSVHGPNQPRTTLEFLYEENVCRDSSVPRFELLQSECWRHSLTEIRVEKFKGFENDFNNLKNFFHQLVKGVKIVENRRMYPYLRTEDC